MNKCDLIEALSESENLTKTKREEIVNLVFSEMTNALIADDRVERSEGFEGGRRFSWLS
jgi:nucleoid DNA-binding protein